MHATVTEHCSASSTAMTLPTDPSNQNYECCECFVTFEEDFMLGNEAEWAQCGCGRWIHVDCIHETTIGENGKPRMCSYCVL